MQTQPTKAQNTEPTVTPVTLTPQPWVKPTFQQVPLADALAGTTGTYDGSGYGNS